MLHTTSPALPRGDASQDEAKLSPSYAPPRGGRIDPAKPKVTDLSKVGELLKSGKPSSAELLEAFTEAKDYINNSCARLSKDEVNALLLACEAAGFHGWDDAANKNGTFDFEIQDQCCRYNIALILGNLKVNGFVIAQYLGKEFLPTSRSQLVEAPLDEDHLVG